MSDDQDRFFAGRPDDSMRNGRYTYPDPITGEARSWQSASNFAYPLVDHYGLDVWHHRQLLIGLARRPDLMGLLAAMVDPEAEKSKLDEIIKTAHEVAGTTVKANLGTLVHEVVRAVNTGAPYPIEHENKAERYRQALRDYGLRVVATERRVVNPAIGACGQADAVLEEADGTLVIGDVKTGQVEKAKHEISVQLAVYQGATHVRSEDDRTWVPLGDVRIRSDYAIVIHIDRDTGAVALYRVDLMIGRHGINLAEQLRGWRKSGPVLLPYVPPAPPVGPALAASTEARTYDKIEVRGTDQHGNFRTIQAAIGAQQHVNTAGVFPEAEQPGPLVGETRVHGEFVQQWNGAEWLTTSPATTPPEAYRDPVTEAVIGPEELQRQRPDLASLRSADDLLQPKVTKAQVQQYARTHGITDLAHTKKVLVEMLGTAGKLAANNTAVAVTRAGTDPAELTGPTPGVSDPTNPHDPAFRTTVLDKIRRASSVAVLGEIWAYVKRQGGDQAWSDEMAEAGKARANELEPRPAQRFELIMAAQSSHDLAQAWEAITVGGSAKERWTEELNAAAQARLAEIQAATPPAPANPFAGAQ